MFDVAKVAKLHFRLHGFFFGRVEHIESDSESWLVIFFYPIILFEVRWQFCTVRVEECDDVPFTKLLPKKNSNSYLHNNLMMYIWVNFKK